MELYIANQTTTNTCAVKVGALYKHYSGKVYKILALAHHSEDTSVIMVVYQGIYNCPTFGNNPVWTRPYSMFTEMVTINDTVQPRFAEITDTDC